MTAAFKEFKNPDGTYDGLAAMGSVTGLSRQTMLEIAADVKANHARLTACARHDFAPADTGARRRVCRNCDGWSDLHAVHWYEKGLAHAVQPVNENDDAILRS